MFYDFMIIELVSLGVFFVSAVVLLVMLYKKVPVLVQLPQNGSHGFEKSPWMVAVEKQLKEFHFNFFEKQVYLHKLLSRIKIMVLKIESKIDELLHGIRKKAQQLEKDKKRKR